MWVPVFSWHLYHQPLRDRFVLGCLPKFSSSSVISSPWLSAARTVTHTAANRSSSCLRLFVSGIDLMARKQERVSATQFLLTSRYLIMKQYYVIFSFRRNRWRLAMSPRVLSPSKPTNGRWSVTRTRFGHPGRIVWPCEGTTSLPVLHPLPLHTLPQRV